MTLQFSLTDERKFFRIAISDIDKDADGVNDWEELALGFDPERVQTDRFPDPDSQRVSAGLTATNAICVAVYDEVCKVKRNKAFRGIAQQEKTTKGWFYGFKLHLVINECGEILAFQLTPRNVDGRKPLKNLCQTMWGKLFGDKDTFPRSWPVSCYRKAYNSLPLCVTT